MPLITSKFWFILIFVFTLLSMEFVTTAKVHTALDEIAKDGKFVRSAAGYRQIISNDQPVFVPERDRYHLYIAYACPWANRCLIVRKLLGLDDVIGLSIVHPTWQRTKPDIDAHSGWVFRSPNDPPVTTISGYNAIPCDGCIPDVLTGSTTIRELYEKTGDSTKKYSVPVLYDKKTSQIVNNESSDIIRMFNSAFSAFGKPEDLGSGPAIDLYPEHNPDLRAMIDAANDWIYPNINNGVYRCGFAQSQAAYDEAVTDLYQALDRLEGILEKQRYLCSNSLVTEADVRLFVTLVRFDEVYVVYFKCNKKRISDYHNIHNYLRELYQIPAFRDSTNMEHIKAHYFTSHPALNSFSVIPVGPDVLADLILPHDRNRNF